MGKKNVKKSKSKFSNPNKRKNPNILTNSKEKEKNNKDDSRTGLKKINLTINNKNILNGNIIIYKNGKNKEKEKDNDINNKKNLSKLMQIPLFKNFNKLKTFIIWRNFIHQNSFEYKYLSICDIVENKIIKNYYLNGIIGKYNNILKEELIWNNYPVPQDFLDIDEKNKDELLLNLYESLNSFFALYK